MRVVIVGRRAGGMRRWPRSCGALALTGEIVMLGDEPAPPYQRPPLSKAYLLGEMEEDRLWLRAPEFWAEQNGVELRLGQAVTAIDPVAKTRDGGRRMCWAMTIWR
jgi:3-phenylpropionate/trans-cinnamate dioxygenase ferredoxin reductase subunit